MARATDEIAAHFSGFARNGGGLSPLYGRLAAVIAEQPRLLALMQAAPAQQRYPTLFFAALHFCVLAHPDRPLARWYPSVTGAAVPAADPSEALADFCAEFAEELRELIATHATQTNEVARCAALLPAFALAARGLGSSLALIELGTSAGLNLLFDRYAYEYGDGLVVGPGDSRLTIHCQLRGEGALPDLATMPPVHSATGVDLHPVDVRDRDATRWLSACVFADQLARGSRLRRALEIARADPPALHEGDLLSEAPRLIGAVPGHVGACVFHSWVVQYLSERDRSLLAAQIARCGRERDLAWISVEPRGTIPGLKAPRVDRSAGPVAIVTLTTFRQGRRSDRVLARAHPHLAWLEWLDTPAV